MAIVTKIVDTQAIPNSRADRYWNAESFQQIYRRFRSGKIAIPKELEDMNNAQAVKDKFSFAGFQFGNWTTNEDRYNYLCALYIAAFDLNTILKFNNDIGFRKLSVAFGARGVSAAVAHYESHLEVINITRYKNTGTNKLVSFITSGGIGAFAHEYAHFLDYFTGLYFFQSKVTPALTGGRSINRSRINYPAGTPAARLIVEDILELAYWKKPKVESSALMKRILAVSDNPYFIQRNEIFARLFEQYIGYKLKKKSIYNRFLCETKYDERIYLKPSELIKIVPLFDKLLNEFRKVK